MFYYHDKEILSKGIMNLFVILGKILIFLKNGKNSKIAEMVQGSLKFFLDLG